MERNINSLIGYSMAATDGIIGDVEEFYFDDKTWTIRYLILKTGIWSFGHKVLIPPSAFVSANWQTDLFSVNLSLKQISDSPRIDTDKPVSRQQEIELYGHYGWDSYWGSGFYAGGAVGVSSAFPVIDRKILMEVDENIEPAADDDPHLRSTANITGYHVHAADGDIGHIIDFIVDDKTWKLRYLVIDTHHWLDGKKVLIAVNHVKQIDWEDKKVFVYLTIDAVKNSKAFEEAKFDVGERVNP